MRRKRSKKVSVYFYPANSKQLLALSERAYWTPPATIRMIVERVCADAEHFQYFDDLMTALDKLRPPADPARPHD
jgi:hypothetical protein